MTQQEQGVHFQKLVEMVRGTLINKSKDYATDTDVLSNFKLAGSICGLSAEQNCLSLISTKVARLGVLLNSNKEPSNESVQDSVLDLVGYSILLSMILNDKECQ